MTAGVQLRISVVYSSNAETEPFRQCSPTAMNLDENNLDNE